MYRFSHEKQEMLRGYIQNPFECLTASLSLVLLLLHATSEVRKPLALFSFLHAAAISDVLSNIRRPPLVAAAAKVTPATRLASGCSSGGSSFPVLYFSGKSFVAEILGV